MRWQGRDARGLQTALLWTEWHFRGGVACDVEDKWARREGKDGRLSLLQSIFGVGTNSSGAKEEEFLAYWYVSGQKVPPPT